MIVHIQLYDGPKQSACGKRLHAIRVTVGERLQYLSDHEFIYLPKPRRYYTYCQDCIDSPSFQMKLLRIVDV